MLRELLATEIELRGRAGDPIAVTDLQARFPDQADWIASLVADGSGLQTPLHPASLPPSIPPRERLGPYRLLREVGRGGMGVVYEAVHDAPAAGCPEGAPAQPLSAAGAGSVPARGPGSSANWNIRAIVTVYEVGFDGLHYFAMPFIAGQSLDVILRTHPGRPLPAEEVAALGEQVAEVLAYAHRQGVIHRDIKPGNLLLGEQGEVWVTDFGLACSVLDTTTLTGSDQLIGTLRAYLPPEAFQGQWGPTSDIYSLGLTLYELLVGKPAFTGDNLSGDGKRLLPHTSRTAQPLPGHPSRT